MKKIIVVTFLPILFVSAIAQAQVSAGASGSGSGYMVPAPLQPAADSGFVQFNNLTVQSVSATTAPAEIVATAGEVSLPPGGPQPLNSSQSANSSANIRVITPCLQFDSQSAAQGTPVGCPVPPIVGGGSITYKIEISATSELMLSNRAVATLSDFAQGDQINVFGYYNTDGSIQAYLVRDLSKPAVPQTIQLNNVVLNSISGTSMPATLAVTQAIGFPCYGFSNAGTESSIACPMGVASFSANPATANTTGLPSLMPAWQTLRKYVVNVDANTIILDRNRTQLSLASLNVGDSLNVYGETDDNGQTVTADIIRDLSIPATPPSPSAYTGTVTNVNADGSFVIQTNNGQTLTVQNPVTIGTTVTVQGLLNTSDSSISQVSNIMIGGFTVIYPAQTTN